MFLRDNLTAYTAQAIAKRNALVNMTTQMALFDEAVKVAAENVELALSCVDSEDAALRLAAWEGATHFITFASKAYLLSSDTVQVWKRLSMLSAEMPLYEAHAMLMNGKAIFMSPQAINLAV